MIFDLKMQKIQNLEHIPVPRGSDKWGPTIHMLMYVMHLVSNQGILALASADKQRPFSEVSLVVW